MERACGVCGKTFEAKRNTARYCGPACRMRKSRAGGNVVPLKPGTHRELEQPATADLESTTLAALKEVSRDGTPLGVAALSLAQTIDDPNTASGARAALVKQFVATLELAMKGTRSQASPIDELRTRRDSFRRRTSAS